MTITRVCPQYFANFQVAGSKMGQTYLVQTNGINGPVFCSCPAYKYSGEYGEQMCKHIKMVYNHGCFYRPGENPIRRDGGKANQLEEHGVAKISDRNHNMHGPLLGPECLGCGEPMVNVNIPDQDST